MPSPTLHTAAIPVINVDTDGNPLVLAPNGNPSAGATSTLVAGTDSTGVVRNIRTNTVGAIQISTSSTSVASGASPSSDAIVTAGGLNVLSYGVLFNNATSQWERMRTATAADATAGAGLLAAGVLGQFQTTPTTYTTGQFGTLQMTSKGILITGTPPAGSFAQGDGTGNTINAVADSNGSVVRNMSNGYVFNGATWDRARGDAANGAYVVPRVPVTSGTNLSGSATTTSGAFNLPANANRRPGDVQGQNVSGVTIGFNEFGGAAVIGAAGTYTVPAGATFSITTSATVNFISSAGTAAVTVTSV